MHACEVTQEGTVAAAIRLAKTAPSCARPGRGACGPPLAVTLGQPCTWRIAGRHPTVHLAHCGPPPSPLTWGTACGPAQTAHAPGARPRQTTWTCCSAPGTQQQAAGAVASGGHACSGRAAAPNPKLRRIQRHALPAQRLAGVQPPGRPAPCRRGEARRGDSLSKTESRQGRPAQRAPSPAPHIADMLTLMKWAPLSEATALASIVLPVPGGPKSSRPARGWAVQRGVGPAARTAGCLDSPRRSALLESGSARGWEGGWRHDPTSVATVVAGDGCCQALCRGSPLVGLVRAPRMNSSGRCSGRMTTCRQERSRGQGARGQGMAPASTGSSCRASCRAHRCHPPGARCPTRPDRKRVHALHGALAGRAARARRRCAPHAACSSPPQALRCHQTKR